jgi:hypothetical protein
MQAIALADALDGGAPREIATALDGARAVQVAEQAAARCIPGDEATRPGASRR